MSDWGTKVWDAALTAYGKVPYHPGKWRVIKYLQAKAGPYTGALRLVRRNQVWYELDLRDYLPRLVFLNAFEAWETRFIKRLVQPGWVAMDIGANIGYYSILLGRLVGPSGHVYCFEPTERCFESLSRNIAHNKFPHVSQFRLAVGDACQSVSLCCDDANHPSKTYIGSANSDDQASMVTLDHFTEEHRLGRVDFIKVDIEGSEDLFLAGATRTLARFRPVVMIELNPTALARFGTTPGQIIKRLEQHGYRLFRITWHGLSPMSGVLADGEYWNVFAFPREGL